MSTFFLGLRFLRGRGRALSSTITIISIIGVVLGVMVPIVVINVITGFQKELKTKILGMNGHLNIISLSQQKFSKDFRNVLKEDERIVSAYPYGEMRGVLEIQGTFQPILLRSYPQWVFEEDREFAQMLKMKSGEKKLELPYRVLVGTELATNNLVENKERLKLIVFKSKELNIKKSLSQIKNLSVKISGIFQSGFQEYDNSMILTSEKTLQQAFDIENPMEVVNIKLKDIWQSEEVKKDLIKKWGNEYIIYSWQELNQAFFRALALEKMLMYLIMSFILLVALFNVTSYQLIQVVERKKEIGILKTLGFSTSSIAKIFLASGFIISSLGAVIGAALGLLISANIDIVITHIEKCLNFILLFIQMFISIFKEIQFQPIEIFPKRIYYLEKIPAEVSYLRAFFFASAAIFFAFLAGLWPSRKAAKMKTMEIMRYE